MFSLTQNLKSRKAFTLLELIVVIVILGLLAALAIPTFAQVIAKSQNQTTLASLKAVARDAQALQAFERENDWEATSAEGAILETSYQATALTYTAALASPFTPSATSGLPTPGVVKYSYQGESLGMAMLSPSGDVCAVVASLAGAVKGGCMPASETSEPASEVITDPESWTEGGVSGDGEVVVPGGGEVTPPPTEETEEPAVSVAPVLSGTLSGVSSNLSWSAVPNASAYEVLRTESTPVGSIGFISLTAVTVDSAGNIYAADSNALRKITPEGFSSTDTTVNASAGLATDALGNVYTVDGTNGVSRFQLIKILPDGTKVPVAGNSTSAGTADGSGSAARFSEIRAVTVAPNGNVYVIDRNVQSGTKIRMVTPEGVVTTLPGSHAGLGDSISASDDYLYSTKENKGFVSRVPITGGSLVNWGAGNINHRVKAVAVTPDDTVYFTEGTTYRVFQITPAGVTSVLAGSSIGHADGQSESSKFNRLTGIAVDEFGEIYVADMTYLRGINSTGLVSTIAGNAAASSGDKVTTVISTSITLSGTETSFIDSNLKVGSSYSYLVQPYEGAVKGLLSNRVTLQP